MSFFQTLFSRIKTVLKFKPNSLKKKKKLHSIDLSLSYKNVSMNIISSEIYYKYVKKYIFDEVFKFLNRYFVKLFYDNVLFSTDNSSGYNNSNFYLTVNIAFDHFCTRVRSRNSKVCAGSSYTMESQA